MISGFADAVLLVCILAGFAIIASLYLAYAAHCLLVVIEGTAAGTDQVVWPDEPVADWVARAAYVGGLAALWLVPAGLLSRALRHDWLPEEPALRFLLPARDRATGVLATATA